MDCELWKHRNGKQILQTIYDKQPNTDDTKTNWNGNVTNSYLEQKQE